MANKIEYTAQDCLGILKNGKNAADANDEFLSFIQKSSKDIYCFNISKRVRDIDSAPLVSYDYNCTQWRAGRYIGNVDYHVGRKHYSLTIVPRFGENILLEMFGEIFNLKLSGGSSRFHGDKKSLYIKMLVSLIWSQKLAEANRHGLPRKRMSINHKGFSVKGRLIVKPSIFSYGKDRTIISRSHEMTYDEKIIAIISEAYRVLKNDYAFEQLSISPNIKDTISDIVAIGHSMNNHRVTEKDYQSISYHPIYQSFKDLVDFSWQIINSSAGMDTQNQGANVSGYLIDMAEVWECYVRSIVQKQLTHYGWKLIDSTYMVYEKTFYQRKIIPDIVLEKNGEFCVFDAKYKRMVYRGIDVDRNDFFQIHTYISYIQHLGTVKFAGLLYPIECDNIPLNTSAPLFNQKDSCRFIADGPSIGALNVSKERFFEILKKGIS